MSNTVKAIEYLKSPGKHPTAEVCVLFGDEAFLKRQATVHLRQAVLGGGESDFSLTTFEGPDAQLRDVMDELSTRAMFGGKRLVVVEAADTFVTRYRAELEAYVARPRSGSVLILNVKTWPGTTKLYKAVDAAGLQVDCSPLKKAKDVADWLVSWARQTHRLDLTSTSAELLVDMLGAELGLLDQELAKLAVSVGPREKVTPELVDRLATSRAKSTWDMLDAALDGKLETALQGLERLLLSGESPIGILAQVGFSLRRLAAATQLVLTAEATGKRISARDALLQVGVNRYFLDKTERQLRRLGRERAGHLYRWLLQADLDLKGDSRLPPQTVLERLLVRAASAGASRPR